jgi:hypothetical protein
MKRALLAASALVLAAVLLAFISAPPARTALDAPFADGTIRGALHVHSTRSDGIGSPEAIARAAADAGLSFVVLTDHGDATRAPDPPAYLDGVLLIDAVEISTAAGHYVALGMDAAPYPLGGEARDVVEDVARLGGFGIVAHPDSPKPALAWHDWDAPFDGVELVNLDTAWRRRVARPGFGAHLGLIGETLGAFVRPPETIARLAAAGEASARWAEAAASRRIVIVAGADAHGGLALGSRSNGEGGGLPLPLPGYAAAFRALSVHVRPDAALTGDAAADASAVIAAIRAGHVYVALDGLATPPAFRFTATAGDRDVDAGDELAAGAPLTLHVRSNAPPAFTTTIWRGAEPLGEPRQGTDVSVDVDGAPAVYRVTIDPPATDGDQMPPWILSNAIYVRASAAAPPRPAVRSQQAAPATVLFDALEDGARWWIETDPSSVAAVDPTPGPDGPELRFRWGLPGEPAAQQYAALVWESGTGSLAGHALVFEARSDDAARISVELREYRPDGQGPRWQRSIHLDPEWTTYRLPFDEFTPPPGQPRGAPPDGFRSLMFVVNTVNTALGTNGRFAFRHVRTE